MRKTYKCSNIKFCMEDDNQRRTWEYLQSITRRDGSYGKVLSDAFVAVLDGQDSKRKPGLGQQVQSEDMVILKEQAACAMEELLDRTLEKRLNEFFQEMQKVLTEQINSSFKESFSDFHSGADSVIRKTEDAGMGRVQEPELSEDMMAFAFAMGE